MADAIGSTPTVVEWCGHRREGLMGAPPLVAPTFRYRTQVRTNRKRRIARTATHATGPSRRFAAAHHTGSYMGVEPPFDRERREMEERNAARARFDQTAVAELNARRVATTRKYALTTRAWRVISCGAAGCLARTRMVIGPFELMVLWNDFHFHRRSSPHHPNRVEYMAQFLPGSHAESSISVQEGQPE